MLYSFEISLHHELDDMAGFQMPNVPPNTGDEVG